MDLYEMCGGTEDSAHYQAMASANLRRQYSFLGSLVQVGLSLRVAVDEDMIKALNHHAITTLHEGAGQYRTTPVTVGSYIPPDHSEVSDLMAQFVVSINRQWNQTTPVKLAAFALWGVNAIHPFRNGNGRTARALCHFILCAKAGGQLGAGDPTFPVLLGRDEIRADYDSALKQGDAGNLDPLASLVRVTALKALSGSDP